MSDTATIRKPPPDLFRVMETVQGFAIRERDMYETLVAAGHRRQSSRDEARIEDLFAAAEIVEREYYRQRGIR